MCVRRFHLTFCYKTPSVHRPVGDFAIPALRRLPVAAPLLDSTSNEWWPGTVERALSPLARVAYLSAGKVSNNEPLYRSVSV